MSVRQRALALSAFVLGALAAPSAAQEALNTPAATMPAPGTTMLRAQYMVMDFDSGPDGSPSGSENLLMLMASYGLGAGVAIDLKLPLMEHAADSAGTGAGHHPGTGSGPGGHHDSGISDPSLGVRARVWKSDTSPLDTARIVIGAGAELPFGDPDVSSHTFDPYLGAAYTQIRGRHGFNLGAQWKWNRGDDDRALAGGDGPSDALRTDVAYLFRLSPERYGPTTESSCYVVLEANSLYETNADREIFVAPGFLWEARTWALEIGVQLPVDVDVDHRSEPVGMIILGVRWIF